MPYGKPVNCVRVSDPVAVKLINERAAKETRTPANAASITIREALGKDKTEPRHPGRPTDK